ncbi:MAG: Kae1-associated kinase Bud32, partial [Nitrososphaerales archaeon]
MKLIYRGAEADVFRGDWCGQHAVYKVRVPLPYRLPELDNAIRSQRTVHEALIIYQSKLAGVSTPALYYVSPPEALLVMEYLDGERLKTVLEGASPSEISALAFRFGESVARLHSAGIMHGDLTTSNVIVSKDGAIRFIDFGLAIRSRRLEDQAVDLRLIKETLTGAHNPISKRFMRSLLEGYASVLGEGRAAFATK